MRAQGGSVDVWLSAKNIAYNNGATKVPAGAHVTVHFDNQDKGIPHNSSVDDTSAARTTIFGGEIKTGFKETAYTFGCSLKSGNYFFRCNVYPTQMNGEFVVQ